MRAASSLASVGRALLCTMANSSPPSRATVSTPRTTRCKRSVTAQSSASPTGWPSESLTLLKRSRSRNMTASLSPRAERLLHLVAEQHAVRQIGERVVPRHVHDLGFGLAALGDVLVGRDPAAVRGRAVETRHHAAVDELVASAVRCALSLMSCARSANNCVHGLVGVIAAGDADFEHFSKAHARPDPFARQPEDFQEAPIDDLEPVLRIVKAQALRHVFQRGVEQQVGFAQAPFLRPSSG